MSDTPISDTPMSATPMSATPRTDEAEEQYWLNKCIKEGEVLTSRAVHSDFARRLEREIRQLEVDIYDLKTENNLLHEALDQVIEDRDAYHDENAELRKDRGYDEGRIEGHELGYSEGYEKGRVAGYDQAINEGYEQGFREGLAFRGKPYGCLT